VSLQTVTNVDGTFLLNDPLVTLPRRFYRVQLVP
jgi:hypothetical protein